MRVNSIQGSFSQPKFEGAFVTLSKKNLGENIAANVVDPFNQSILPQLSSNRQNMMDKFEKTYMTKNVPITLEQYRDLISINEIAPHTDFWALGAGSGSRFKPLADAYTAQTGIPANKISLPMPLNDGRSVYMLDWAMAMGVPFAENNKIETVIAELPSGSFGDIVKHYQSGNPVKDIIMCCGDNVFDTQYAELMGFAAKVVKNPNLSMALVGIERRPEDAAEKFGIITVGESVEGTNNEFHIDGFEEKPPLHIAKQMVTPKGMCAANSGMFVIKKEEMEELLKEIEMNPYIIAKNPKNPYPEIYDFAAAAKWVQKTFGAERAVMKVLPEDAWEDVGEPEALYSFYNKVKGGQFLNEFGSLKETIQDSFSKRFFFKNGQGAVLLSDKYDSLSKVPSSYRAKAPDVEGVTVIA